MKYVPLGWFRSLHAKLFIVTALVTSLLTIAVAYSITRNSRREILNYTRNLAWETSSVVETEILQRWDKDLHDFKNQRALEELLEGLAGEDRSIFQIDVFRREGADEVALVTSSADDAGVTFGKEIGSYMRGGPQAELVDLNTGNRAWKFYLPIKNPKKGQPPLGLIRTYCDLEHWETVWDHNLRNTYVRLPFVLLGEFILLWVILATVVTEPIRSITDAMTRLERGDPSARTDVRSNDELGIIANRFNLMAAQLERASLEREQLIAEIKGLNAGLQNRIHDALSALQAKNQELENLMEGNALLREELSQQERLAVAGQLTAAFAHEVGTPLNLVNSHLQLLEGQSDVSERTRDRLGVIRGQIERVGDIVRKMMSTTRRPRIHPEPVPLGPLMADLQRLWSPTLASHGVTFGLQAPDPCVLHVDRKQMEQLFLNMVNNSVDAMPDGGRLDLTVEPDPEGRRWLVSLADTGMGIPPEVLPKVFKPMFTTKPDGKGTGLGLAICREIIRAHGGEIHIESEEGKGTTMRFPLPAMP
ncbi:sensor histidine kinase [Geothrix sp. 21YS21S-2]|uniref:sensor histidine kinase n=1 Tax=Geothrix sp. 21YS21S-2 TaxID=3068893 RepID=UPI0027B8F442|nr:HAMP domain-containing sensor histidine kinase [Geothrix sp. 21YS21S-2]